MGTLPQLAVVKGKLCPLQPTLLHRTFESNVDKFCGTDTALIYNGRFGRLAATSLHLYRTETETPIDVTVLGCFFGHPALSARYFNPDC